MLNTVVMQPPQKYNLFKFSIYRRYTKHKKLYYLPSTVFKIDFPAIKKNIFIFLNNKAKKKFRKKIR